MSAAARPLVAGGGHPAVTARRLRDGLTACAVALVIGAATIGIAIAVPKPSIPLALGGVAVAILVGWMAATPRLERSVTALVIFLGCINGPLKLIANAGVLSSGLQDILILAVTLGLIFRMIISRTPARLPPLSGWVIAWIVLVLVEAFNPETHGILHALGGWRQQLQWVPFFWFGYLLIRTPQRFRMMFWILGIVALLNAFASTGQTQASPEEIASLGSGYNNRVYGVDSRKYISPNGEGHVRPFGLGDDAGTSASIGLAALPGMIALFALSRRRWERWAALILTLGSLAGVITGLGRLQVVGAAFAIAGFVGYSLLAGRRIAKPILAVIAVAVIALPLGSFFVESVGSNVFSRYTTISPEKVTGTATGYKSADLEAIPKYIAAEPFGFGLGTAGSVTGFGGKVTELYEGHNINAETEYNLLVKELGVFGILLWVGFLLRLLVLPATHLRKVRDTELQVLLAALAAPLFAVFFMAVEGPVSIGVAGGLYLYFAAGVMGYWFLGDGRRRAARDETAPGTLVAV
jgi:hypothetical protein